MLQPVQQVLFHLYGMWRYRWTALLAAFLVCLVGWTVVSLLPDKYESKARVSIDTSSALAPILKGIAAESDPTEKVTMIKRTLLSRPNLQKLARQTDLDLRAQTPEDLEELLRELHNDIEITEPFAGKFTRGRESVIVYDIRFVDRDSAMAHKVVQALVDSLVEGTLGEGRGETDAAERFLQDQIAAYEAQLKVAEQRLAEFKALNTGFLPGGDGGQLARLHVLTEELEALDAEYEAAMKRRDLLQSQLQGEVPVETAAVAVNPLDAEIAQNRSKLNELLLQFTEQHPDVRRLRENIVQLEQRKAEGLSEAPADPSAANKVPQESPLYQTLKLALQQAEVDLAALESKRADRKRRLERARAAAATIPQIELEFANLSRDYDVIQKQYVALTARLETAKLSGDMRASNFDLKFQIIEPPVVPLTASEPNRLMLHSGVLAAGVGAGAGLAFLLNMLLATYLSPRELRSLAGFPVLGKVSELTSPGQRRLRALSVAAYALVFVCLVGLYGAIAAFPEKGMELAQNLIDIEWLFKT